MKNAAVHKYALRNAGKDVQEINLPRNAVPCAVRWQPDDRAFALWAVVDPNDPRPGTTYAVRLVYTGERFVLQPGERHVDTIVLTGEDAMAFATSLNAIVIHAFLRQI